MIDQLHCVWAIWHAHLTSGESGRRALRPARGACGPSEPANDNMTACRMGTEASRIAYHSRRLASGQNWMWARLELNKRLLYKWADGGVNWSQVGLRSLCFSNKQPTSDELQQDSFYPSCVQKRATHCSAQSADCPSCRVGQPAAPTLIYVPNCSQSSSAFTQIITILNTSGRWFATTTRIII